MFTLLNKAYIAIILTLGAVVVFQYFSISDLKEKSEEQEQTIKTQSESIKLLKEQEKLNKKLTLEISRLESEMRSISDEAINTITYEEKSTSAYSSHAPRSIIDFLRK
ncbi:DUF2570 family protein [Pasteurella sp. PK-2025]|uniref:DUF2570 family protein n=1 Tax=Pasteurella sp. PK-2025 TaxID=3413133 RepID=UPI003C744B0A